MESAFPHHASPECQQQKGQPPLDSGTLGWLPPFVAQGNVGTGISFQSSAIRLPVLFPGYLVFLALSPHVFFAPGIYRSFAQIFSPVEMAFAWMPRRLGTSAREK
jgi:hypothetical protein